MKGDQFLTTLYGAEVRQPVHENAWLVRPPACTPGWPASPSVRRFWTLCIRIRGLGRQRFPRVWPMCYCSSVS